MSTFQSDLLIPTQRDAASLLYNNGVSGILVSIITSTLLVFGFSSTNLFELGWWAVMTLIMCLRMTDLLAWRKASNNGEFDGQVWTRRFSTGVNVTAILWSIYTIHVVMYGTLLEMTATIIIIASLAGGSATVLAADKRTAVFYVVILLLPASLCLLFLSEQSRLILGVLGICFCAVMAVVSKKSADFTQDAIRLKNENAVLVNHMEQQVEKRTQQIYELSNIDPLTGLFNRAAFLKHLKASIQQAEQSSSTLALLFIDLDGFKKINDTFGHEAGDQILRESAARLEAQVSDTHSLCRWGGDEFLIVSEANNMKDAETLANTVITELSKPHLWEGTSLSVGATVGISMYPEHSVVDNQLIQFADMAMYHQKKAAPSKVCFFNQSMTEQHSYELKLKTGLSEAIEKEQLRLVYQPIVYSADEKPAAMEALLRWNFDGEPVGPDKFIPIAEQYGLIQKIGAWVLKTACQEAAQWHGHFEVPVCVNVSVIQLQDPSFIDQLNDAISQSSIDPKLLHIEITESVFATDTQAVSDKIRAMQKLGVKVSIDDFGTGYSSLSVMQDLAVNTVKLDRTFINKIDTGGFAIVTAVIHAARLLKFEVVAEGVETKDQMDQLTKLGVPKLQGFYFSKPLEQDRLEDYFSRPKHQL